MGLLCNLSLPRKLTVQNVLMVSRFRQIKVVVNAEGLQIFRKVSPFSNQVKDLMDKGVRFYLCLSTVRNLIANGVLTEGNVAEELIEGVEFVPSGVTAVPDLQRQGYVLVKQDP
uniref:Uncharacterized protein n=1 Tax=Amphora coffeiformis TaxID=265554 RepID=A0A7S3L6E9_9STRA|mmetsp:Transcript_3845/g.7686  ORF Transcript_3845/g.7686 Transcript_3845/m.7686 type:complete len:114 (+) Transcript_3845:620-961(+)